MNKRQKKKKQKSSAMAGTFIDKEGNSFSIGEVVGMVERKERLGDFHSVVRNTSQIAKHSKSVKPKYKKHAYRKPSRVTKRNDLVVGRNNMNKIADYNTNWKIIVAILHGWNVNAAALIDAKVLTKAESKVVTSLNIKKVFDYCTGKNMLRRDITTHLKKITEQLIPRGLMSVKKTGRPIVYKIDHEKMASYSCDQVFQLALPAYSKKARKRIQEGQDEVFPMSGDKTLKQQLEESQAALATAQAKLDSAPQPQSFSVPTEGVKRVEFAFSIGTDGQIDVSMAIVK